MHGFPGGMHGEGGCAWQRGVYMVRGVCVGCTPPLPYEIWSVNAWAVRILLGCILATIILMLVRMFLWNDKSQMTYLRLILKFC